MLKIIDRLKKCLRTITLTMFIILAAEYGRWNGEAYYENLWQTNVIGTKHIVTFTRKIRI